jgi:hypothetical protein
VSARPAPLRVVWGGATIEPPRAGALCRATVEIENAGSAAWRSISRDEGVKLSYHWLDELGNPIVWDGIRTDFPAAIEPGQRARVEFALRAPMPSGTYRLALDLVDEGRCWFAEVGNEPLELEVRVRRRLERRALAARGADPGALEGQEEPVVSEAEAAAVAYLAPGCVPAPDWSRRVLDAHEEGFAIVGGAVERPGGWLGRPDRTLASWAGGRGRVPGFPHPLLCPSVVVGLDVPLTEVEGLPAVEPPRDEPAVFDGRIRVRARRRSGRRRG